MSFDKKILNDQSRESQTLHSTNWEICRKLKDETHIECSFVIYNEQMSEPIPVKIPKTLIYGLNKMSAQPVFKFSILSPRYRHFMSEYREN